MIRKMGALALLLTVLFSMQTVSPTPAQAATQVDVIVFGGTPAGVSAALAAKKHGANVVLFSESSTVGGMMSNGISASDIGAAQTVQGLARTFFQKVRSYYKDPNAWRFEPKVAESILSRMLSDARVPVHRNSPLVSAQMNGRKISCVTFKGKGQYCAKNYIDASYSGDLIAAAGVPANLGPADMLSYNESIAQARKWYKLLEVPAAERAAGDAAFDQNPFVDTDPSFTLSETFEKGRPSLAYRLCVTKKNGNKVMFPRGANYDQLTPSFRYMMRTTRPGIDRKANGTLMSDVFHLATIPGGKYDLNAGRRSFTNMPAPEGYFTSYTTRMQGNEMLRNYVTSFFHFVQNDPAVPADLQAEFRQYGLCADEFVSNENWPLEPYVREARRIQGRDTITAHDLYFTRTKSDSVALGAYNVDAKLSRLVYSNGTLYRDMGVHATAPLYEIPFSAMVPKYGSVTNLLAPVGVSSSPTAYGSIRMEPQYMALGEAAGVAVAIAKKEKISVAAVSPKKVQAYLKYRGVNYKAVPACKQMPQAHKNRFGFTPTCKLRVVKWRAT